MNDGPEWFAPRRYGIGMGRPIAWQGRAVVVVFAVLLGLTIFFCRRNELLAVSIIVPLTFGLIIICARTTRGGWRWRWGEKE